MGERSGGQYGINSAILNALKFIEIILEIHSFPNQIPSLERSFAQPGQGPGHH